MDEAVPTALVGAARDGSPAAIETLLRLVWPHAFRIAFSIVRDRCIAEDAAQEACARAFAAIATLRSDPAFGVWFYRIVVREAFAQNRNRDSCAPVGDVPPSASPFTSSVVRLDVLNALGKLSPRQRATVALHYYARLNSFEIAGVLGIADSSVRFHLACARRRLEFLLEEHRGMPRERTIVPHASC
ncbi:MAG: sigma-70 family RNA polymerase sigma factor [Candidatus Eremiobacteraeota bacterium]|nr:sigma-70 family RNA polymerase sigma factor [Candidatus Eremiobacteraeota bacterium]